MDTELIEQNVHRLLGAMSGAATTAMVAVGDQLGLYRALADGGPATPDELAARTGTAARYLKEWLSQQAAAGFLAYRAGDGRYVLPAEAAAVLAHEASPAFLAGGATITRGWFAGLDRLAQACGTATGRGRRLQPVPAGHPDAGQRRPRTPAIAGEMKHRTVITMTAAAGLAAARPVRAPEGRMVVLRDGSAVQIRQVRSTDALLLADGFARLSAASRRMRFLSVKKELSTADLRYFTDVDHHDHEALAALDQAGGHGVGIARYIRDAGDPQAAEIAVTIVDDWQGRGLGTELLARLSDRARSEGIRRFTALADAGNVAVAALLRNAGARLVRRGPGTVEYEITLTSGPACAEPLDRQEAQLGQACA